MKGTWIASLLVAAVAALALVACGGDDETSATSAVATDDEAAITDTIRTWLTEGGCELMTPKFLEDQTFISDPEKACEAFENAFTAPSYSADAVLVSEISVTGTKATATVGDEISNVTSTYDLVKDGDVWRIDSVDL